MRKGVGAVGMCFTGGFALAMMTEPSVVAPVLVPALQPHPRQDQKRRAIDASPAEIACAKRRFQEEDLSMIGLRFVTDRLVPDERFEALKAEFGDKFEDHRTAGTATPCRGPDCRRIPYLPSIWTTALAPPPNGSRSG